MVSSGNTCSWDLSILILSTRINDPQVARLQVGLNLVLSGKPLGVNVPIQPKAAGFNQTSATYERGRPEYPGQALRFTFETLGIAPASTVIDLD